MQLRLQSTRLRTCCCRAGRGSSATSTEEIRIRVAASSRPISSLQPPAGSQMRRRRPHEGTDGRGPNPDVIYVWPGRRLARRQQPKAAVSRRARPGQRGWQSRVARERVPISPRPGARRTPRGAAIRVGSGPVAGKLGPQPVTRREAAATKIKAEFNFPVGDASAPGEGSPAGHAMGELRRLRHRGEGRAWHHPGGYARQLRRGGGGACASRSLDAFRYVGRIGR